jgi:hypothetical protein
LSIIEYKYQVWGIILNMADCFFEWPGAIENVVGGPVGGSSDIVTGQIETSGVI